jgi:hypothetical protein
VDNSTSVPNFICAPAKGQFCKPCLIILDKLNLIFITLQWDSQCMKFFAGNILKELKIMGPHNLTSLNKINLKLKQLMCIPLYAANSITFLPDRLEEHLMLQTHPWEELITKNQPQYGPHVSVMTDRKAAAKNVHQGLKP